MRNYYYNYKNTIKLFTLFLGSLVLQADLAAQFTLTAEVRPRSEYRNGFKTPSSDGKDAAFFTEQRSRLYMDYKDEKYKFRLTMQDVRFWGEIPQIFKEEDGNTFLSEAWGQYFVTKKFSVKAGRQIISYDNQRFLGGLEWAQQGRRHDALLFIYEDKEKATKFHAGFAYNTDDDVPEPAYLQSVGANFYSLRGNYKALQYAWFNKELEGGKISLLALNAVNQNPDSTNSSKQTFGFIGSHKVAKKLSLAGDFYYQTGKIGQNNVNAFLAGLRATYKTDLTPITVGMEYISGKDDDDTSSDITNFSPDFGTNHAFNGLMDYFFVGPSNGNVGVMDLFVKTKFKLKKGTLLVNAHEFMTGSTQLNTEGRELSKSMGMEIDLVYTVKLAPSVTWNIGYSQLFGTDTLLELRSADRKLNNWGWMMITFKPALMKSE
ncbi:MAG: alginate export family protein [Bacteroidota bacterium]